MSSDLIPPNTTAQFLDVDGDDEPSTLPPVLQRLKQIEQRVRTENAVAAASTEPSTQIVDMHQLDLFEAQLVDYKFKNHTATMEAPLFSLATKPDMDTWRWTSQNGKKWLEVTPSSKGRATIHDKDLLIYISSQLVAAMNEATKNGTKKPGRRVRFVVYDFLTATRRETSGRAYERFEDMVDRLSGTRLKTNIEMGNLDHRSSFGLIERADYLIETDARGRKRMTAIEITISEWLYRALETRNVLTINDEYFSLRKPLERRLYEVARKHVGAQSDWIVSEEVLFENSGSSADPREFRRMLNAVIAADSLLDYRLARCGDNPKNIRMYQKDPMKFALGMAKKNSRARAIETSARGLNRK